MKISCDTLGRASARTANLHGSRGDKELGRKGQEVKDIFGKEKKITKNC
jgi:hypothetical protein